MVSKYYIFVFYTLHTNVCSSNKYKTNTTTPKQFFHPKIIGLKEFNNYCPLSVQRFGKIS